MSILTLPISSNQIADDAVIENALSILSSRLKRPNNFITSVADTKAFLKLKLEQLEHEVFSVILLNNKHGVIQYKQMFRGTIDGASVYPREVVKEALTYNASAVILAHNHPSGNAEPSRADITITAKLKEALALIDVRVLDHLIVGEDVVSFAERGLL
jgi:DNA repair protein RadC